MMNFFTSTVTRCGLNPSSTIVNPLDVINGIAELFDNRLGQMSDDV